jgi:hypothetical protein
MLVSALVGFWRGFKAANAFQRDRGDNAIGLFIG